MIIFTSFVLGTFALWVLVFGFKSSLSLLAGMLLGAIFLILFLSVHEPETEEVEEVEEKDPYVLVQN